MSFLSGMFESQMLRSEYVSWLNELRDMSEIAGENGAKSCNRCGWCCARRPCMPTPDEVKLIASYLNLGVKEAVKKYFVADRLGGSSTKFVFPAKETQMDITGTFINWRRTYDTGHCYFYDKERRKCTIYSVRPQSAKIVNCWEEPDEAYHKKEADERLSLWDEVDIEEFGIEYNGWEDD